MGLLLVTGLLALEIGSLNAHAYAQGAFSRYTVPVSDKEPFKLIETGIRQTLSPTTIIPLSTLGVLLENTQIPHALGSGLLDGRFVSPTTILDEHTLSFTQTATTDIVEASNYHESLGSYNISCQNFSLFNTTIKSHKSFQRKRLASGEVPNSGLLKTTFLLGLLAAIMALFLLFSLLLVVEFRFQRNVFQFLKCPFEFNLCEELENVVPGFLLRNGQVQMDIYTPARFVPPLGYVILTESGTCLIDPRPNRQITEEEDKSKFGTPVEALSYPRSPLGPLTSCIAGSRPESPISKAPRKVTFADENEIFLFPRVNITRERNIRRRLSRSRLNSAISMHDSVKQSLSGPNRC